MKHFLPLLAVLAGCSTVPQPITRVDGPTIMVIRDTGFLGSGCDYAVFLNDARIGKVAAGGTVSVVVKPGEYSVRIGSGIYEETGKMGALCGNITMTHFVKVDKNPVIFRMGITSTGQVIFDRIR